MSEKRELLEPSGVSSSSILNICGQKPSSVTKPNIGEFPKATGALARVKNFLPQLKKAEEDLKQQIDKGENVNIEDIEDDKHIEMNVELFQDKTVWSEDSDPDSPPSPPERDNAYTSDSDSSSSDSVSSSSSESLVLKLPSQDSDGARKPQIQELN